MSKLNITPGEVREYAGFITTRDHEGDLVIIAGMIRHGKRGFAEVNSSPFGGFQDGFTYATKEENEANASLYAEAHNVAQETGKSPRELMEQRDAAVAALRKCYDELKGFTDYLADTKGMDAMQIACDVTASNPKARDTVREIEVFLASITSPK